MVAHYTLYVVPHTHWDREWYGSYQLFRTRLVRLMNKLLALLERDPEYRTFNLDGQTIILEDYLEIHPEKRATLERLIRERRLLVGPWYILPDEFLSSGESLIHNLLLGGQIARRFGHRMNVGYIPDTFGHIAQLPQILRGFGIDNAMHFRGLDPAGLKSELWWQSPDGSRVLLHHLSNIIGYSDSAVLDADPQRAAYDLRAVAQYKAERAAAHVLLALQGVDHAEAREDLPTILHVAEDLFDDITFVHASLEEFWAALTDAVRDVELQTVYGELRDVPRSPGGVNFLLHNVLSSRIDNKLQNARTLAALERWAEPWCALSWMQGIADYPQGHLWAAWRWLLQNHPHDSLGGCSVDAVHRQMATRFEWASEIADSLTEERFRLLAQSLDLSAVRDDEIALLLFNAVPWDRDEVVTVDIDLPMHWLQKQALAALPKPRPITPDSPYADVLAARTRAEWAFGAPIMPMTTFRSVWIRPLDGEPIPVEIVDITDTTIASALASGPRGTMDVRRVRVHFRAQMPACGYTAYAVSTDPKPVNWSPPSVSPNVLENEYLRVQVHPNGTFDLTDLESGQQFSGLGSFEDGGDCGDGYVFSPPPFDRVYTTHGAQPAIMRVGRGIGVQHVRIQYAWALPARLNDARQRRIDETILCPITVDLMLRQGSRRLELEVTIDNRVKDHRLRMLFPTDLADVERVHSAMQFDVIERPITPVPIAPGNWWVEDPPQTFPQHGWTDLADGLGRGLCVISEGIHECAVLNTPRREIALTLLRAVGYLGARQDPTTIIGGAGPSIPTPEAQLQRTLTYRLALHPHTRRWQDDEVWRMATEFLTPPRALTVERETGARPPQASWLRVSGRNVVLSAVKRAEEDEALIVRLFNPSNVPTEALLWLPRPIRAAALVDLQETLIEALPVEQTDQIRLTITPKQIVTLRLALGEGTR
jgi:alpha-mannosidase